MGQKLKWWGFTSCTTDGKVLQSEAFCGSKGSRTLFIIKCVTGKNISKYSSYSDEAEVR